MDGPVAVYGAVLATLGLALNALQALRDHPDLQAEVTLQPLGSPDNFAVQVRLWNRGRRPAPVDSLGLWVDQSNPKAEHPYWWVADDPLRNREPPIPATIMPDAQSTKVVDWPHSIARRYVRHDPPAWLFAKPADGQARWWPLPDDVRAALAAAWPGAQEVYHREVEAATSTDPDAVDDYGQPLQKPVGEAAE